MLNKLLIIFKFHHITIINKKISIYIYILTKKKLVNIEIIIPINIYIHSNKNISTQFSLILKFQ